MIKTALVASLIALALAVTASAQPQWGTQSTSTYVAGAFDFQPYDRTLTGLLTTNGVGANRRSTCGGCSAVDPGVFNVALHLPSGAQVTGIRLAACPNVSGAGMTAKILECTLDACVQKGGAISIGAGTTCSETALSVTPFTVDNAGHLYLASVGMADTVTAFSAVRIDYKLQVSAPPLTPTFADVPDTHPFYQYIEALAASGITSGCSGPPARFCPDAPVTRGQMAVFLARALGLHWTP